MSPSNNNDQVPNPILATALGVIESVAPGALDDPVKALRDLVPRLRFLVIERVERPTIPQLETIRAFDKASSLVQIRKAVQSGALHYGPFPGDLAERALMPELIRQGLSVSLRELNAAEREQQLAGLEDEKA